VNVRVFRVFYDGGEVELAEWCAKACMFSVAVKRFVERVL